MNKIEVTLKYERSTPGTNVFVGDETAAKAGLKTQYLGKRESGGNNPPKAIKVTIEPINE